MKLNIDFRNISSDGATIDYIDHRLSFALARTKHAIQSTAITVSDINGSRGGIDKLCKVVIKPVRLAPIVISERQASLRLAIDRGISRASQNLARQLKRKQHSLKGRQKPNSLPAEFDDQIFLENHSEASNTNDYI